LLGFSVAFNLLECTLAHAAMHNNVGIALGQVGRVQEAIVQYEQALRIKPDYAEAHCNLGLTLIGIGRLQEGMEHFEDSLRIVPNYATAHAGLGIALERAGRVQDAMGHYEQALRIRPDLLDTQNNLAWLLATLTPAEGGDPSRALALAQRACALKHYGDAGYLDTLAAAYAASGRFAAAVATAQKAIDLARSAGQTNILSQFESRLELYRAGQPYRWTKEAPL
jgi:tetratricopeptide (TPR) repeat protein